MRKERTREMIYFSVQFCLKVKIQNFCFFGSSSGKYGRAKILPLPCFVFLRFHGYLLNRDFNFLFGRVLRDSTPRFVGRSVCWSHFSFSRFLFFDPTAPAQMVLWPQIWPLPTRTRVAMYPALLLVACYTGLFSHILPVFSCGHATL